MNVLPRKSRFGRLNPPAAARPGVARLLERQWWPAGTGVAGADIVAAPVVPPESRWCDVRLIGAGGRSVTDPGDSSFAWMGAGGCYARRLIPARPGQILGLVVGGQKFQGSSDPPAATELSIDGVVVCRAAGGPHATVGNHGAAPLASDCIGDVIRPGGPGAATALHGGRAGGDQADVDRLNIGGVARQPANVAVPEPFDDQLVVADYGAGGVAGLNGALDNRWWPPAPSGGAYILGGPGLAVLEFYDRRPY